MDPGQQRQARKLVRGGSPVYIGGPEETFKPKNVCCERMKLLCVAPSQTYEPRRENFPRQWSRAYRQNVPAELTHCFDLVREYGGLHPAFASFFRSSVSFVIRSSPVLIAIDAATLTKPTVSPIVP